LQGIYVLISIAKYGFLIWGVTMKLIKHIWQQPFIFATGLAALIHSTWSIGTLFTGNEPTLWSGAWWAWMIPAFLIAFSLDIGQIVTSAEIRHGKRTFSKYVTFFTFAIATYFLQWLYIMHHMPEIALSDGVRDQWSGTAMLIRDLSLWIAPLLLPLLTFLYTLSSDDIKAHDIAPEIEQIEVSTLVETEPLPQLIEDLQYIAECASCGWTKTYDNEESSNRGLATHQARHCTALHPEPTYTNGNQS
jgi:hypothetical protein